MKKFISFWRASVSPISISVLFIKFWNKSLPEWATKGRRKNRSLKASIKLLIRQPPTSWAFGQHHWSAIRRTILPKKKYRPSPVQITTLFLGFCLQRELLSKKFVKKHTESADSQTPSKIQIKFSTISTPTNGWDSAATVTKNCSVTYSTKEDNFLMNFKR